RDRRRLPPPQPAPGERGGLPRALRGGAVSGGRRVRLGVGACILHRDPQRAIFKNKPLLYVEQEFTEYAMRQGALVYLIPIPGAGGPGGPSFDDYLDHVDGLLLQGGADVAPG